MREPVVGAVVVAAAMLAGCQPAAPTPTPTTPTIVNTGPRPLPSPSPSVKPAVVPERCVKATATIVVRCTAAEAAKAKKDDALYAEALAVWKASQAESDRLYADYRLARLTPVLERTTTGAYRKAIETGFVEARQGKVRRTTGPAVVKWRAKMLNLTYQNSLVIVRVCFDGSRVVYQKGDGTTGVGRVQVKDFYFKRFDGDMKIFIAAYEDLKTC